MNEVRPNASIAAVEVVPGSISEPSFAVSFSSFVKYVTFEAGVTSKVEGVALHEVVSSKGLADVWVGGRVKTFSDKAIAKGTTLGVET